MYLNISHLLPDPVRSYRRPHQHLTPQLPFTNHVVFSYFSVEVGFLLLDDLHAGERLQDLSFTL